MLHRAARSDSRTSGIRHRWRCRSASTYNSSRRQAEAPQESPHAAGARGPVRDIANRYGGGCAESDDDKRDADGMSPHEGALQ